MKIRIKGNSIRFRLTQPEVKQLAQTGRVTETTQFGPDARFTYSVVASAETTQLEAQLEGPAITLFLPATAAAAWPGEERVGFRREVAVAPNTMLFLLLEKDFVCLDDTEEDQSDNYPNPRAINA